MNSIKYVLLVVIFLNCCVGCNSSRQLNNGLFLGDTSLADHNMELLESRDISLSKTYFKIKSSEESFNEMLVHLESKGYDKFKKSKALDLDADVFTVSDLGKDYMYSSFLKDNRNCYSIIYCSDEKLLTLIWFYSGR